MPLHKKSPTTPSERFHVANVASQVTKRRPEKSLTEPKKRTGGRNSYGRVTSRRRGGGHKKLYRVIDFKRDKFDVPATVESIEYDPNRSALIALLNYADGEKRYIIAPEGLAVGAKVVSSQNRVEYDVGNNMPLSQMPPAARMHAVELRPNTKAQIARSAGNAVQLVGIEGKFATLRMPSGELRQVLASCRATLGVVGNGVHQNQSLGKAGRNRWKGRRPRVRGVAMNPVDHPMGGGEGRTSGGGHPVSPWGQLAKGYPTRRKKKTTNTMILVRRNGRKMK